MKLKFGAFITDGRGKIGGHVASKNRAGAYLRTKVTPSNPNTVAQAQARGILASLSQQWSALSESQRLGWNDAVKEWGTTDIFGDIKKPSGINLFVKLNANLISVGFSQLLDVPQKMDVPSVIITSANLILSTNDVSINFDSSAANGVNALIRATPTLSNGVSFVKSQFRVIGNDVVIGNNLSLQGAYGAKFGMPLVGANVYASVQFVLPNGQKTTEQKVKIQVVP